MNKRHELIPYSIGIEEAACHASLVHQKRGGWTLRVPLKPSRKTTIHRGYRNTRIPSFFKAALSLSLSTLRSLQTPLIFSILRFLFCIVINHHRSTVNALVSGFRSLVSRRVQQLLGRTWSWNFRIPFVVCQLRINFC